MTKYKAKMTEWQQSQQTVLASLHVFVIRHSSFIRHSSLGLRHFRGVMNPKRRCPARTGGQRIPGRLKTCPTTVVEFPAETRIR
jgi:hypothetical protein